jgi:hypothetical protein
MEIGLPKYNANPTSYTFQIVKPGSYRIEQVGFYEIGATFDPPANLGVTQSFVTEFLEKTRKYFTTPLTSEKVLRHLRHTTHVEDFPKKEGWYTFQWQPFSMTIKSNDFDLNWQLTGAFETEAVIPSEFTNSTTPRAQSPAPEQKSQQVRNIQIHDSLIPVGDLPLSDLPPLSFGVEETDPAREETRRRIREARLKVQLAKLKAQRMEQKYYERYGQVPDDSEESSDFSSDSEEQLSFQNGSH